MWAAVATTSTDLPMRTDTVSGRFEGMDLTLPSAHVVRLATPIARGSTDPGSPRSFDRHEHADCASEAKYFSVGTHLLRQWVREPTALRETTP